MFCVSEEGDTLGNIIALVGAFSFSVSFVLKVFLLGNFIPQKFCSRDSVRPGNSACLIHFGINWWMPPPFQLSIF